MLKQLKKGKSVFHKSVLPWLFQKDLCILFLLCHQTFRRDLRVKTSDWIFDIKTVKKSIFQQRTFYCLFIFYRYCTVFMSFHFLYHSWRGCVKQRLDCYAKQKLCSFGLIKLFAPFCYGWSTMASWRRKTKPHLKHSGIFFLNP